MLAATIATAPKLPEQIPANVVKFVDPANPENLTPEEFDRCYMSSTQTRVVWLNGRKVRMRTRLPAGYTGRAPIVTAEEI